VRQDATLHFQLGGRHSWYTVIKTIIAACCRFSLSR